MISDKAIDLATKIQDIVTKAQATIDEAEAKLVEVSDELPNATKSWNYYKNDVECLTLENEHFEAKLAAEASEN